MKMPDDNDCDKDKFSREMHLKALLGDQAVDSFELELFEWYAKETDDLLEKSLHEEIEYLNKQYGSGYDYERINDSGIMAVEYYAKRIRGSHAIYLTSLLETFLKRSCSRLECAIGTQNLPLSLSKIKGNQWERKRKFLEECGGFSVPDAIWSEVHALILIRNNLVHDNGETCALKEEFKILIASKIGVSIERSEIAIEKEYINHAFDVMKSLFRYIDEQIKGVIKNLSSSSSV